MACGVEKLRLHGRQYTGEAKEDNELSLGGDVLCLRPRNAESVGWLDIFLAGILILMSTIAAGSRGDDQDDTEGEMGEGDDERDASLLDGDMGPTKAGKSLFISVIKNADAERVGLTGLAVDLSRLHATRPRPTSRIRSDDERRNFFLFGRAGVAGVTSNGFEGDGDEGETEDEADVGTDDGERTSPIPSEFVLVSMSEVYKINTK